MSEDDRPDGDRADAAEVAVRALLEAAGVHPSEGEIRALARAYPGLRRQVDALYRVPTGDDAPATMLHAELGS